MKMHFIILFTHRVCRNDRVCDKVTEDKERRDGYIQCTARQQKITCFHMIIMGLFVNKQY